MRAGRLTAVLCLLGLSLSAAVGPGIRLLRCTLTGRVSIDCCCDASSGAAPDELGGPSTQGCCTVQRLASPWSAHQLSARPPSLAAAPDLARPTLATGLAARAFQRPAAPSLYPPPLWLRVSRV